MNLKLIVAFVLIGVAISQPSYSKARKPSFFEIKVYHIKDKEQEDKLDNYLKAAFLPALARTGIKNVGVFKPIGNDTLTDKRVYILIPIQSAGQMVKIPKLLDKDKQYLETGSAYLNATHSQPPYQRIETILLQAFPGMPQLAVPQLKNPPEKRVYELRSYEGPTERLFKNKVQMFNEGGEIALFDRLGFNAVFYASVISGSHMPNLMYMTTHEDMTQREAHWKAFGSDPEWKKLSAMDIYQNNVSKIDIVFLRPTDYSGI